MGNLGRKYIFGMLLLVISQFIYAQEDFSSIQEAFNKSYTLEANGDFKEAANEIKQIYIEDSYEANLRLGWLNYMAGNFNESIAFYNKSIDLMPYADEPKFGYIFPLSAIGNWDEVIKMYNAILENSNHNTKAMYYLGTIYYNRKQYDKSIEYFKKVTDLYPFDFDSLYMYAWCNLQLGRKKEAKLLFQKALMNKPNNALALEGLTLSNK
ncbi:tetratricopeptide repeat protein [Lutibacter citreus]|uniref:tetratricopeptide repeat protein n=1 Tax=Lutibacter citreus TaxID=2138210 RepID=UPI001C554A71|nr:tetratricopeptide repeat protein [Lutibacter citreus]